ncbi:hypothetical protein F3Y22_tig00110505pilonHSYRG00278 [Hibiscus syriacus]|uniref:Uncharacterized protein n=1 Tax=Hibiscus syriacus TaxID=106335 RepID=A0A6A3AD71_HIBSY|nr:hypothetical protein F3Y22_tig00110505pilonHSYRG00278 [Hibiscus syriacus]
MPPPLSGTKLGTVTGEPALGAGETAARRGLNDQGYTGDDKTGPPKFGAGAAAGDNSGAGDALMESFESIGMLERAIVENKGVAYRIGGGVWFSEESSLGEVAEIEGVFVLENVEIVVTERLTRNGREEK